MFPAKACRIMTGASRRLGALARPIPRLLAVNCLLRNGVVMKPNDARDTVIVPAVARASDGTERNVRNWDPSPCIVAIPIIDFNFTPLLEIEAVIARHKKL
jgi:hypothetical protein